jgi:hypothetical protein
MDALHTIADSRNATWRKSARLLASANVGLATRANDRFEDLASGLGESKLSTYDEPHDFVHHASLEL